MTTEALVNAGLTERDQWIAASRPSSSFRLWSDRIDSGIFTIGQCRQWAHAIAPLAAHSYAGGHRTNLTTEEAERLYDKLADLPNGVAITDDHADKGREWVRRHGERVGLPTGEVVGFRMVGAYGYDTGAYRLAWAPIYRAHLADGRSYDYAPTPWQASAYGQRKLPLWWEWHVDNAACTSCGRSDLPLHTDYRCPECYWERSRP